MRLSLCPAQGRRRIWRCTPGARDWAGIRSTEGMISTMRLLGELEISVCFKSFLGQAQKLMTFSSGQDFQFSSQPAPPVKNTANSSTRIQPRGPIASTESRYKPKPISDPFAASEDDFYSSRSSTKSKSHLSVRSRCKMKRLTSFLIQSPSSPQQSPKLYLLPDP